MSLNELDSLFKLEEPSEEAEEEKHKEGESLPQGSSNEGIFGSYASYLSSWFTTSMSATTTPTDEDSIPKKINRHYSFDESLLDSLPTIKLRNRKEESRKVMTLAMAESLRHYLPVTFEISSNWRLIYSLDQDGASLNTLYRFMEPFNSQLVKRGFVLIVKDNSGCIFGSFFTTRLHVQKHYYGTGESFLFWMDSNRNAHVYSSTGKNDYFVLSQPELLAFGGGGDGFGLSFNDTFLKCMTAKCETFDNLPMTNGYKSIIEGSNTEFECTNIEVWVIES
eukprot:NODE_268_length_12243_cov_0.338109.p4 type:complete len:279 gc:universal NODE_268_length_12243_cov_0.338109:3643-2807(-)